MPDEGLPPLIRLTIDTDRPVRASDAGLIFNNLPYAVDQYRAEVKGPSGQLRLTSIHIGSLGADFMAFAGTVVTLYEFREVLLGFMARLIDAYNFARGHAGTPPTDAEVTILDNLERPVASDEAKQVILQVFGDNANILIINADTVAERAAKSPKRPKPQPIPTKTLVSGESRPVPRQLAELVRASTSNRSPTEDDVKKERKERAYLGLGKSDAQESGRLEHVGGRWYVRLHSTDTLLPLDEPSRANGLPRTRSFQVRGIVLTSEDGRPVGFYPLSISGASKT